MPLELLASIREAEREAEDIRLAAQRESRDIIKSVEEAMAVHERGAARDLIQLSRSVVADRTAQAEAEIAGKADERRAQRERVRREALTRAPEAARLITERILGHGDR